MFNSLSHQGHANQKCTEIQSHTRQYGYYEKSNINNNHHPWLLRRTQGMEFLYNADKNVI